MTHVKITWANYIKIVTCKSNIFYRNFVYVKQQFRKRYCEQQGCGNFNGNFYVISSVNVFYLILLSLWTKN